MFGYRTLGFGSVATAAGAAPIDYDTETTITVGNRDFKSAHDRGWDGAWGQGASGGGIGAIADGSITGNRDDIARAYVQGHDEKFYFAVWSSSASSGSPASFTAWTYLEIVKGDGTVTRYEKDSASAATISSGNGAGARLFTWSGPNSGSGLNTDGASTVVMGGTGDTVTIRIANV